MPSQKKKNKLKNSYCAAGVLKNKKWKCKRIAFYTPSQRRELNNNLRGEKL